MLEYKKALCGCGVWAVAGCAIYTVLVLPNIGNGSVHAVERSVAEVRRSVNLSSRARAHRAAMADRARRLGLSSNGVPCVTPTPYLFCNVSWLLLPDSLARWCALSRAYCMRAASRTRSRERTERPSRRRRCSSGKPARASEVALVRAPAHRNTIGLATRACVLHRWCS